MPDKRSPSAHGGRSATPTLPIESASPNLLGDWRRVALYPGLRQCPRSGSPKKSAPKRSRRKPPPKQPCRPFPSLPPKPPTNSIRIPVVGPGRLPVSRRKRLLCFSRRNPFYRRLSARSRPRPPSSCCANGYTAARNPRKSGIRCNVQLPQSAGAHRQRVPTGHPLEGIHGPAQSPRQLRQR